MQTVEDLQARFDFLYQTSTNPLKRNLPKYIEKATSKGELMDLLRNANKILSIPSPQKFRERKGRKIGKRRSIEK